MKSYLSLVPISAKVHKRQSRMTRICIILAVFLVTSIFSMVEMWTKAETTAMRHNHGDWHIALQNIQDNEAEQIRKDNDVAFSSWYDSINANAEQDYYIGGKNAVIYGIEEAYSTNIMNYPTEGNYPQNEKEVVLSADANELFGVKVGDSITLNTHAGDLGYTITGFYQDDSEFNSMVNGICVYVNRDTFNHIRSLNGETSASQFYIRFQNENRLKKTIADFKLKYNLTDENVKENMAVLSMLGTVRKISGIFHIRAKLHRFFLADLLEHQHTIWISQGDAGRVIEIIAKKDRLVDNLPLKPDHRDFLCHKLRVSHVHAHEIALLV